MGNRIPLFFHLSYRVFTTDSGTPQPLSTPTLSSHVMRAYRLGGVTAPIAPMTLTPSVFPLFIEDSEISSLITLINSSGISSSATLSIRSQQGTIYPTVSAKMLAHAKVQIKVADLLRKVGAQIRVGSILVHKVRNLEDLPFWANVNAVTNHIGTCCSYRRGTGDAGPVRLSRSDVHL